MAFKLDDMGVSSSAGLTLAEFDSAHAGTLSSYARVVAISGNQVTINSNTSMQFDGVYGKFEVGADVLFHVTATAAATYKKYLGCYCVATITGVNGYTLTLDKDVTKVIPASEFGRYYVQLISFARFESLNLKSGVQIVPPAYSTTNFYGGIVAIKVFGDMTLSGGHINLTDRGIPVSATSIRPLTTQETNGTLDTDKYSGWENAQTKDRFLLNCGDGAAFILVYGTLNRSGSASRIGNPSTYGVQCCRGASDSVSIGTKPENITNVGGSTILIAAKNFSNFAPALIAKYRSTSSATGQGLCRAYIASDTTLGNDEGLYSYDCIANKGTISEINIRSFGTGEFGTCNTTAQLNNYAQITLLSPDCKTVTYTGKTTNGIAKIQKGALVMLHASQKAYAGTDTNPGKFTLAHVLEDTGSTLKLDFPAPNLDPTKYVMQVVSIPQYSSFAQNNSATLKFNGVKGGIFAVAVNGTCDLSGKQILVEAKGGGTAYGKPGAATEPLYVGNAQIKNRLPIGQGHGSVFILAKNLVMNTSTRIGARYSGAKLGGMGFDGWHPNVIRQEGEKTHNHPVGVGGGYATVSIQATGGSGAGGGVCFNTDKHGGYGSSGVKGGPQGAHIFIVADTITGFNQAAISTGGTGISSDLKYELCNGGAGYGAGGRDGGEGASGGSYNGGGGGGDKADGKHGGGSSGWAFIYCNNAVNQSTVDTVLFD